MDLSDKWKCSAGLSLREELEPLLVWCAVSVSQRALGRIHRFIDLSHFDCVRCRFIVYIETSVYGLVKFGLLANVRVRTVVAARDTTNATNSAKPGST